MSVVAPVAALFGAALPVTVGVAMGEQLSLPALVGIGVAVAAVALVSREEPVAAAAPAGAAGQPPDLSWPWWPGWPSAASS